MPTPAEQHLKDSIDAVRRAIAANSKKSLEFLDQATKDGTSDVVRDLLLENARLLDTHNALLEENIVDQLYLYELDVWDDACATIEADYAKARVEYADAMAQFLVDMVPAVKNSVAYPQMPKQPPVPIFPPMPRRSRTRTSAGKKV